METVIEKPVSIYEGMSIARASTINALQDAVSRLYKSYFPHNNHILEIGSGDGFLYQMLMPHIKWTEIDINTAQHTESDRLICASATLMPFADRKFDGIIGFESLNTFREIDLKKTITESARVLVPGSSMLVAYDMCPTESSLNAYLGKDVAIKGSETIINGLPAVKLEYIPRELRAKYDQARDRHKKAKPEEPTGVSVMSEMHELGRMIQELAFGDPIWVQYATEATAEFRSRVFQEQIAQLMSPHFEDIRIGIEFGYHAKQTAIGEGSIDERCSFLSESEFMEQLWETIRRNEQMGLFDKRAIDIEAVAVPYIIGENKK